MHPTEVINAEKLLRRGGRQHLTNLLVPELRSGDVVIMDNLSSHKRASVRDRIEAASATLRFLPSGGSSTSSSPQNAPTTLALADMTRNDRKPL